MVSLANDICNMALDLLKEATMTDYTTETTPEALWFQREYATSRDAEFEDHPWRFAIKEAIITVDATAPTFSVGGGGGWSYRYARPADFLRMGYLNYNGDFEADPVPHEIQGDWIYCNQTTSIYLVYIYQITDVTKYYNLFNEALAAKMAMKLANWLTGKTAYVQIAAAAYDLALKRAKRANALLSTPERPYDSDVINARYTSGSYFGGPTQ